FTNSCSLQQDQTIFITAVNAGFTGVINNPGDVYTKALDATTKSAVYDFKASYVRAVADQTATAGYVKTNTAYTITYQ
ncbi:hypothetical protein ACUOA5_44465, partial [Escherichia coli]